MSRRCASSLVAAVLATTLVAISQLLIAVAPLAAQQQPAATPAAILRAEQKLAATISETRMVETVRRLVAFGPRMYGTPSNHESAAWLASAFRTAGLDVSMREDPPRDWYQPVSWQVSVLSDEPTAASKTTRPTKSNGRAVLASAWPSSGSPSSKGEAFLSVDPAPGAVCLVTGNPAPNATTGCVAVLYEGRASESGWPGVGRLRGTWTIPVFAISANDAARLRERVAAGGKVHVAFALEAKTGKDVAHTVVATLAGRDRSKYLLFCAHGDSDSGGPGADDNASGVAIVLEVARALASAVRSHAIAQPPWDIRFAVWGGEMSSTREYVMAMDKETSRLQAVFNFDQSGFGSWKDALYVEPDDVPVNRELITVVRGVMKDHVGARGFPQHAASVKSQGGTDSYVFQMSRTPGATVYPAITLYTSAWDRERPQPITDGFPPFNWYADEKPGMVTVDGDRYYHSVGDTPAHTTDTEPFNMGWCARVGMLSALRLMATPPG